MGLDTLRLNELSTTQKQIQHIRKLGLSLVSVPAPHLGTSALSFCFNLDGTRIVVSGDTDVSENLSTIVCGADLFLCECSTPDKNKIPGHLSPSTIKGILEACVDPPKKIVLTHFYPWCDGQDLITEITSMYSREVILAEDLMTIEVVYGES